jgi:hypothetical protein
LVDQLITTELDVMAEVNTPEIEGGVGAAVWNS